jgi:hypothetical protein
MHIRPECNKYQDLMKYDQRIDLKRGNKISYQKNPTRKEVKIETVLWGQEKRHRTWKV